jgi:hypothetical protein
VITPEVSGLDARRSISGDGRHYGELGGLDLGELALVVDRRYKGLVKGVPRLVLGTLILLTLLAAGCSGNKGTVQQVKPGTLVPWRQVGDIRIGEATRKVESEYGKPGHGLHVIQRYGKRGSTVEGEYRAPHGGAVYVTFGGARVQEVGTDSPYYRTRSGLRVDGHIPFGPCHKQSWSWDTCEHHWHGFVYNAWGHESACHCWTKVSYGRQSLPAVVKNFGKPWLIIYTTDGGRITAFDFDSKYVD